MKMPNAGRAMAYAGVMVGLGISTTINVMHAIRASTEWWAPWLDGSWPVLLFIALEVLTRTQWGSGGARYVAWAGVGGLALVAGTESYWNLRDMMIGAHKEVWLATIGPLGIDGLMASCAAALLVHDEPAHSAGPAHTEAAHGTVEAVSGAVHRPAQRLTEAAHEPAQQRPTELTHPGSPQVIAPRASQSPVSQDAVDKVIRAVSSGQPMGKAAIMAATGLSRSTAGRALTHLVTVGRLSTIGKATQPDYVMAQDAAHGMSSEATRQVVEAQS